MSALCEQVHPCVRYDLVPRAEGSPWIPSPDCLVGAMPPPAGKPRVAALLSKRLAFLLRTGNRDFEKSFAPPARFPGLRRCCLASLLRLWLCIATAWKWVRDARLKVREVSRLTPCLLLASPSFLVLFFASRFAASLRSGLPVLFAGVLPRACCPSLLVARTVGSTSFRRPERLQAQIASPSRAFPPPNSPTFPLLPHSAV